MEQRKCRGGSVVVGYNVKMPPTLVDFVVRVTATSRDKTSLRDRNQRGTDPHWPDGELSSSGDVVGR